MVHFGSAAEVASESSWSRILAVCWFALLSFVKYCKLRVVVLGPGSSMEAIMIVNKKNPQYFLLWISIDPQSAFIRVKYHGIYLSSFPFY